MKPTKFSREFAMPNAETFSIKPIKNFVHKYTNYQRIIVDPFARNSKIGTITNDLNPNTNAKYHMRAEEFLDMIIGRGIKADVILYDPPYSPTQVKQCYQGIGMEVTQEDTRSSFYTKIKNRIRTLIKPNGIVLSFGWNSMGMGKELEHLEILMVSHGGNHNDTICVAQQRIT